MAATPLRQLLSRSLNAIPIALIRAHHGPVLNYHACFATLPCAVAAIDNVHPEWLHRHLHDLQRHFTFLPIDEFAAAKTRARIAALTFDDGYRCVLDSALPVCAALNIPLTVFLNTSSLEGKPFWRHKVVYVIENGLAGACERSFRQVRKVPGLSFYQYLKHPINSSVVVESELDAFLSRRGIGLPGASHLIAHESQLVRHPLLTYGNHTHNHYVLSSLTLAEQFSEIDRSRGILASIPNLRLSRVFSPPFGQACHVNDTTFDIAQDLGYTAVLLNRGYLNRNRPNPLPVIERFSPAEVPIRGTLRREFIRTVGPSPAASMGRSAASGSINYQDASCIKI